MKQVSNKFDEIVERFAFSVPDEVEGRLEVAEGTVPPELTGVLMRNGPGRLERGGVRYGHPFDGDGMVSWFSFRDGAVHYRNRFVRTREYISEEAADRVLHRGFGTNLPGGILANAGRLRFKNAANTSVVAHGGQLLALWEGGWPHALDGHTGQTKGRYGYGGRLKNRRSAVDAVLNPELPFSAHPRVDAQTGELFNFGMAFGPKNRLMLYCVDADGVMHAPKALALDTLSFVHDFITTADHLVFLLPAVSFQVGRALLGLSTPVTSLHVEPDEPMRALIIEKAAVRGDVPLRPRWVTLDRGGFVFHMDDAHVERGTAGPGSGADAQPPSGSPRDGQGDKISFTGMWLAAFPDMRDISGLFVDGAGDHAVARPVLFELDVKSSRGTSRQLSELGGELPQALPTGGLVCTAAPAGRPQPFYSGLARFDFTRVPGRQTVAHVTSEDFGPRLVGEPVVTDAGWLLCLVCDAPADRTALWIVDPLTLRPATKLALPHRQPPGLHGRWLDARTAERYTLALPPRVRRAQTGGSDGLSLTTHTA